LPALGSLKNFRFLCRLDPVTYGWVVILAGTAARIGLNFLTGVLVVRMLGPVDFGVYSLLTAVMGLAGVVVDFGLTEAAVKNIAAGWAAERSKALLQAQVFFWLRLGLAGSGIALAVVLAQPISRYWLKLPDEGFLFILTLFGVEWRCQCHAPGN
jgi:O-antigen/teichoic acid export membrane protein